MASRCTSRKPTPDIRPQAIRTNLPTEKSDSESVIRTVNLTELPDVVLFAVFSHCTTETLGKICQVCKRLQKLVYCDIVWAKFAKQALMIYASGRKSKWKVTCLHEHCRLSTHWVRKQCTEFILARNSSRLLPWMQMDQDKLWVSSKHLIRSYNLHVRGLPKKAKKHVLALPNTQDVTRFAVKDNVVVSGCRDGSVYMFEGGRCVKAFYKLHETDAQAVDFHNNILVSGSRDKTVKIVSLGNEVSHDHHQPIRAVINLRERVWSLAIQPAGGSFTVGTAGVRGTPSLSVWDLHSESLLHTLGDYRYGAGVLDMKYEDDHCLLSCGYDACLRLWDLRTGKCVNEWTEPYDSTLYCVQTDSNVAMVTGTAQHGMVRLWDKRTNVPVQEYFFGQKSPVYSLAFDSRRIYAALDLSTNYKDFTDMQK
ncbi:F-box/WD repeat-containing protein 4-like [Dreissena polymorpha]|uniref:F-box domain-containing protein n=1 Tax=Dreissena polymorpha TaxID=45954 RepID=A0A9D4FR01_DREPO|nr:F-box/WD repeat-containing protein 4-like [Dreissena polymorpha]KAH3802902.1 hypothetical protein DPMN_156599 [Dreissena polymorpha]